MATQSQRLAYAESVAANRLRRAVSGADADMVDGELITEDKTFVVHCYIIHPAVHEVHIFKSETRADECIQELITRNNMTPDPDPEDGHEEACDTDPQCVAYKACGLAATSKIWKLVL